MPSGALQPQPSHEHTVPRPHPTWGHRAGDRRRNVHLGPIAAAGASSARENLTLNSLAPHGKCLTVNTRWKTITPTDQPLPSRHRVRDSRQATSATGLRTAEAVPWRLTSWALLVLVFFHVLSFHSWEDLTWKPGFSFLWPNPH